MDGFYHQPINRTSTQMAEIFTIALSSAFKDKSRPGVLQLTLFQVYINVQSRKCPVPLLSQPHARPWAECIGFSLSTVQ